jgi:Spy/CpxP family protein refolding chaperone
MSSAVRAKLLVFAVFLIGLLTGALLDNVYETRWRSAERDSRRQPEQQVNQLYDFLELTPEQRQQVKSIMDASSPEFQKLFADNRELLKPNNQKIAELQEQTRSKIRAILNEEQVKKYNEFNERNDRRRFGPPRAK